MKTKAKNKGILTVILLIICIFSLACCLSGCRFTPPLEECKQHNDINFDRLCDSCRSNIGKAGGSCTHIDTDGNGICDVCYGSVIVFFDLYAINDLHGKFTDGGSQPGVDELTAFIKKAQKNNENVLLFSSGDSWQGSAESGLTHGKIITEWMNELDFKFMTLGNHEFDWSHTAIAENAAISEFPFLAINVFSAATNKRADFCSPSVIVDIGEIQIGFIGAIGDCYSSISAEMSEGYYFKVGKELTELVKAEADSLRARGADFIVYSLHDGADESSSSHYDISLSRGYVDMVFEGHTHRTYCERDSEGVYHLQGGGDNSGISHSTVAFNFADNKYKVKEKQIIKSSVYGKGSSDPIVTQLMKKYNSTTEKLSTVLGQTSLPKDSTELRRKVAELYYELGEKAWGQKYDIVLGGGYLSCRSPGRLDAGNVEYGMLYMLFPFDNKIALCSCKGSDLLKNFINSTNNSYYTAYGDYGRSVKGNIDPEKTYYLITDSYNYTYAPNKLTVVELYSDQSVYARDLMADFIASGGYNSKTPDGLPAEGSRLSVSEIISVGKKLPAGGETPAKYYVSGKLTSIENTVYGNVYITNKKGDRLYIYGLYGRDGNRFDSLEKQPRVGDEIEVYGSVKRYVSTSGSETIELFNAVWVK